MRALHRFADQQFVTAIGLALFLVFFGLFLSQKLETKWGYALSLLATLFALYALWVNRFLPF